MRWYILKDKVPVLVDNPLEAAVEGASQDWKVADTNVGEVHISTAFLGQEPNALGGRVPQLFETMIFGGEHDGRQERCATWDQAVKQHEAAVSMVSMSLDPEGTSPASDF